MKKKGREVAMALKLDMNKAYDRVEWDFLEAIMKKLGLNKRWISWTMECVRTVSYSLIINGLLQRIWTTCQRIWKTILELERHPTQEFTWASPFWGKSKFEAMGHIRDKILSKLKSWKQQLLS